MKNHQGALPSMGSLQLLTAYEPCLERSVDEMVLESPPNQGRGCLIQHPLGLDWQAKRRCILKRRSEYDIPWLQYFCYNQFDTIL